MTEGATVTWELVGGRANGRRFRFEPLDRPGRPDEDWYRQIEEEHVDGSWREVGSMAVKRVQIEVSDGERVGEVAP